MSRDPSEYARRVRPLRLALLFNASFSVLSALMILMFTPALSVHLGSMPTGLLGCIGLGLLVFAASVFWQATRTNIPFAQVLLTIAQDIAWVAGSVVALSVWGGVLSRFGWGVVCAVALVVAGCAWAQAVTLVRALREWKRELGTRHYIQVDFDLDVSPNLLWSVVSDLGSIQRHAPGLSSSDFDAQRLTRTCRDTEGRQWCEELQVRDDSMRTLAMRFETEDPHFPFPMHPMYGGWRIDGQHNGSRVTIWWSFSAKIPGVGCMIAALMSERMRSSMYATVRSMAAVAGSVQYSARSQ